MEEATATRKRTRRPRADAVSPEAADAIIGQLGDDDAPGLGTDLFGEPRPVGGNFQTPPRNRGGRPPSAEKAASAEELTDALAAFFNGVSRLPGQAHWQTDPDDVRPLARPLARKMARGSKAGRFAAEHADSILLVAAVVGLVLPKLLISFAGAATHGPGRRADGDTGEARRNPLSRRDDKPAGGVAAGHADGGGVGPHAGGNDGDGDGAAPKPSASDLGVPPSLL